MITDNSFDELCLTETWLRRMTQLLIVLQNLFLLKLFGIGNYQIGEQSRT